jgi:hypothetical protein
MEKKPIPRGVLVGAFAGLLAFVFARISAEPQIAKAIDYESGRDAAQAALDKAAGLTVEAAGPGLFSRTIQADAGIGVGMILFGVAMGALFAVAYTVCLGRVGALQARTLALLVAGGGFLGLYLVPFLKYPANPPAIGHEDTIQARSALSLIMVVCSIRLGKRLQSRFGNWNATLLAVGAFVVAIGIVFPGFPAEVLFAFRCCSVAARLILWTAMGLAFALLAERLLQPARPDATTSSRGPDPVPA